MKSMELRGSWVHGSRPAEARRGRCGPGLVLQMCPEPGSLSSLCLPLISKRGCEPPPTRRLVRVQGQRVCEPAPSRGHSTQWWLPAVWSPRAATLARALLTPISQAEGLGHSCKRKVASLSDENAHLEPFWGLFSLNLTHPGRFRWWCEVGREFSRLGFS